MKTIFAFRLKIYKTIFIICNVSIPVLDIYSFIFISKLSFYAQRVLIYHTFHLHFVESWKYIYIYFRRLFWNRDWIWNSLKKQFFEISPLLSFITESWFQRSNRKIWISILKAFLVVNAAAKIIVFIWNGHFKIYISPFFLKKKDLFLLQIMSLKVGL